jgi:hypothetical protein
VHVLLVPVFTKALAEGVGEEFFEELFLEAFA